MTLFSEFEKTHSEKFDSIAEYKRKVEKRLIDKLWELSDEISNDIDCFLDDWTRGDELKNIPSEIINQTIGKRYILKKFIEKVYSLDLDTEECNKEPFDDEYSLLYKLFPELDAELTTTEKDG